jgi:hypothetical protein
VTLRVVGITIPPMQTRQGKFADLVVRAGQSELVQGAADGVHVEAEAALTCQGALAGVIRVDGVLIPSRRVGSLSYKASSRLGSRTKESWRWKSIPQVRP